jgi:hypothetical protein
MEQEKKVLNVGDAVYVNEYYGGWHKYVIDRVTPKFAFCGSSSWNRESQRYKNKTELFFEGRGNTKDACFENPKIKEAYTRKILSIKAIKEFDALSSFYYGALKTLTTHQLSQLAHFLESVNNPFPGLFWTPCSEPPTHENLVETIEVDGNGWSIGNYDIEDCVYYGQDGLMLSPAFWREVQPLFLPENQNM